MKIRKYIVLASLLFFALFIAFTLYLKKGDFGIYDLWVTVTLQKHISTVFDLPFTIFSLLGAIEITGPVWLVIVVYFMIRKNWLTVLALTTFVFSQIIEIIGKSFLYHPAPPDHFFRGVEFLEFPRIYVPTNYSYPSGHLLRTTFLVFFIAGFFYLSKRKIKFWFYIVLFVLFGIMALSRVYLGEHWTSDVLGGFFLGASCAFLSLATIKIARNKNHT